MPLPIAGNAPTVLLLRSTGLALPIRRKPAEQQPEEETTSQGQTETQEPVYLVDIETQEACEAAGEWGRRRRTVCCRSGRGPRR